jgi:hypothetical protein
MMRRCVIRLGPIATGDTLAGEEHRDASNGEPRTLFDSMRLAPDAPLLVDHDPEQVVGRVVELARWDDGHELAPWLAARVEIFDGLAEWVSKRTAASFKYLTLHRSELHGWEVIRSGYVREVSVLHAGTRPAEPLARVVLIRDEPEPERIIRHCGRILAVR